MVKELAFLILGAILGAAIGMILPAWVDRLQAWRIKRKKSERKENLSNKKLVKWLQNYHDFHSRKPGIQNELPFCEIGGYRERVPYLSKKAWDPPDKLGGLHRVDVHRDVILRFAKAADDDFEINEKLIRQRKRFDQEIWDAHTLYLEYISHERGLPIFHVKTCRYYASATSMIAFEDETIRAVKRNSFEKCGIRERYYLTTHGIENNLFIPITIGCLVVFALKFEEGYEIILQTRSDKTVTSNAVTSVVPVCGLSPFIGDAPRDKGLLYYNFLREYLEELHYVREARELKKEELTNRPPEAYYEWLYDMEQARMLTECEDFNLYYIGFGFNLTNGNPNIGLLAKLDDLSVSRIVKRSIFFNWEVNRIRFVNSKSEELGELFSSGQLDPASSFFLSKALRYLR